MSEKHLNEIRGWELMRVRERCGWSRPRLRAKLLERKEVTGDPCEIASIQRYESMDIVPTLFIQRCRDVMGHDAFDGHLELIRENPERERTRKPRRKYQLRRNYR